MTDRIPNSSFYIGLDSGSVSLNTIVLDEGGKVLAEWYDRLKGDPVRVCRLSLARLFERFPRSRENQI